MPAIADKPTTDSERVVGTDYVKRRFNVGFETVRTWINNGELIAINVAASRKSRPIWRIRLVDLDAFEASRSCRPLPKQHRARSRNTELAEIEFFK